MILLNNFLLLPRKEEGHGLTLDKYLWPVLSQCLFKNYDESQSQYLLLFVASSVGVVSQSPAEIRVS